MPVTPSWVTRAKSAPRLPDSASAAGSGVGPGGSVGSVGSSVGVMLRPLTKMLGMPTAPVAAGVAWSVSTPCASVTAVRVATESASEAGRGVVEPLNERVAELPETGSCQRAARAPVDGAS